MFYSFPLLSFLIWLPILGSVLVLFFGHKNIDLARYLSLIISLLSLLLCALMLFHFSEAATSMQFTEKIRWIPFYHIYYSLGVDGISMPLIVLTCFTTLVVVLASWTMVHEKTAQYLAVFLIMQGMVIGVFCALDAILFYFFWEGMLIPMYLSIGIWGGQNKSYAAIKFFLYTFFGSALMLIVFLYLGLKGQSFDILSFYPLHLTMMEQRYIFFGFLLAFAIKIPMWPVHTWLPDAHTEAPTGGSVILAALMLKIGAYGFLRFSLPIVPDACKYYEWFMIVLSLISIVYVGFIALAQTDMKRLIAYSSVSHMGFVTLGLFLSLVIVQRTADIQDAYMCVEGAMTQMISHAFGSGAMFLGFGMLYQQVHSRLIKDYGGIAKTMPYFAAFYLLFAMSNIGLPGTSGFVGEFMIILSAFKASFWVATISALSLIVGASYTLWMFKRVFYGQVESNTVAQLNDISGIDRFNFLLLAGGVLFVGLYPNAMVQLFHASTDHLLQLSIMTKL